MLRIPFDPSRGADQTFQVLVPEEVVLTLRLVWNTRAAGWDVTVSTSAGSIGMLRLVPRFPLLYEHRALSHIQGDIIALPLTGGTGTPLTEYTALGESWGLFWLSQDDMAAWEAANGLG